MLIGSGISSRAIFNAIRDQVTVIRVIIEEKQSVEEFMIRRAKRLGILAAFGQIMFMVYMKVIDRCHRGRLRELVRDLGLDVSDIPTELVTRVESINGKQVCEILKECAPDAVVVNGTRIIGVTVIEAVPAPFINTHMGITPRYRGVHGGYWALANGDAENCGVTVHLVDVGVDTGGVLYQKQVPMARSDYFSCYPLRQLAAALPLIRNALRDVESMTAKTVLGVGPSRLWYHPTIVGYLTGWLIRGIR